MPISFGLFKEREWRCVREKKINIYTNVTYALHQSVFFFSKYIIDRILKN